MNPVIIPIMRHTLFQAFALFISLVMSACSPFPPPSTGIISSIQFQNECFDLTTGTVQQRESCTENRGLSLWDFAFLFNAGTKPHARLALNPMLDVKAAYPTKDYASLTLSDALTAPFTGQFQDQPFQLAIIQTPLHNYYKVHVIREKLNRVWFEWEQLK